MSQPNRFGKTLWTIAKFLLAIVLLAFVFSRINFANLHALTVHVSIAWIATSFIIFIGMTLVKALEYWLLLERPVPYGNILNIVFWQNAISNFVATAAGIASYLTLLRVDENVRVRRATAAFVIAKLGDLIAAGAALILSAAFVWARAGALRHLVFPLVAMIFITAALFIAVMLDRRLVGAILNLMHGFSARFKLPGMASVVEMLNILGGQENARMARLIQQGIFLSSIYFLLTVAWLSTLLKGLAFPLDFWPVVFVITLGQLISIVPIQVLGGLGVYEATNLYFYSVFGIPQNESAAMLFGMRLLFYAMNALVLLYFPIRLAINTLPHKPERPNS